MIKQYTDKKQEITIESSKPALKFLETGEGDETPRIVRVRDLTGEDCNIVNEELDEFDYSIILEHYIPVFEEHLKKKGMLTDDFVSGKLTGQELKSKVRKLENEWDSGVEYNICFDGGCFLRFVYGKSSS